MHRVWWRWHTKDVLHWQNCRWCRQDLCFHKWGIFHSSRLERWGICAKFSCGFEDRSIFAKADPFFFLHCCFLAPWWLACIKNFPAEKSTFVTPFLCCRILALPFLSSCILAFSFLSSSIEVLSLAQSFLPSNFLSFASLSCKPPFLPLAFFLLFAGFCSTFEFPVTPGSFILCFLCLSALPALPTARLVGASGCRLDSRSIHNVQDAADAMIHLISFRLGL
mmetsp:Transcript_71351/g.126065  ORF Transcript_71351/g.126065 Transcript_71351/m.126065 type:complete len:222 (+) Transcript_71351:641-1306(+)